jgi:hypothetical protein
MESISRKIIILLALKYGKGTNRIEYKLILRENIISVYKIKAFRGHFFIQFNFKT